MWRADRAVDGLTVAVLAAAVGLLVLRGSSPPATTATVERRLGEALRIDFRKAPRTLILVVQQDCGYCSASMPFYRTLVESRNRRRTALQIVVAAPARDADISKYLASHGLAPDLIVHPGAGTLPVHVTPTLLLAGPDGELVAMWEGFLSASDQDSVAAALFAN